MIFGIFWERPYWVQRLKKDPALNCIKQNACFIILIGNFRLKPKMKLEQILKKFQERVFYNRSKIVSQDNIFNFQNYKRKIQLSSGSGVFS